jgi:hypothetical protein
MQSSDAPNRISNTENTRIGAADSPLRTAESYVAASADPSRSCDGGREKFTATFSALCEWGEKEDLIRAPSDFEFFQRSPDSWGNEHQVWFNKTENRWYKATFENEFGLAWGRKGTANPREYLTRLILQNIYFGDDIRLIALLNCKERLRILISQPHIAGDSAPYDEIQKWFVFLGFVRLESADSVAWYQQRDNILVADAHEGNVILTSAGFATCVPIDLNLVQPNGKVGDWVKAQMESLSV